MEQCRFLRNNLLAVSVINNCDFQAGRSMIIYTLSTNHTYYIGNHNVSKLIFPQYRAYMDQYHDDVIKCMFKAYGDTSSDYLCLGNKFPMLGNYDQLSVTSAHALYYSKFGSKEFQEAIEKQCVPPSMQKCDFDKIYFTRITTDDPDNRSKHLTLTKPIDMPNEQWPPEHLANKMTLDYQCGTHGIYGTHLRTVSEIDQVCTEFLQLYEVEFSNAVGIDIISTNPRDITRSIKATENISKLLHFVEGFVEQNQEVGDAYQLYVWYEVNKE